MAVPTFVNLGTITSNQNAITPPFGTGWQADDIMIGIGECNGNQAYTVPTGWAHVTGSPVNVDTSTRLTVIWRRFVGGDTALSWGDSGDHNIGQIGAFRGVKTSGDPWNAVAVDQETVADTSATWPAVTTTVADCLILFIIATGRDIASTNNITTALSGGTGLTSITERTDNWVATLAGGGIGMITATKAAAGSTGNPTATMGSTDSKALMTLALQEPPPVAVNPRPPVVAPSAAAHHSHSW